MTAAPAGIVAPVIVDPAMPATVNVTSSVCIRYIFLIPTCGIVHPTVMFPDSLFKQPFAILFEIKKGLG